MTGTDTLITMQTNGHNWLFIPLYDKLPIGYYVFCYTDEATEGQAGLICERGSMQYRNYITGKYTAATARKSLLSLMRHHGLAGTYVVLKKL